MGGRTFRAFRAATGSRRWAGAGAGRGRTLRSTPKLRAVPHRSKRPATRADVARLAGVSESTVSYALSGVRSIADDTRERILAAMEQLGYTPNVMAQGLAGKRTGLLALLFPVADRGFATTDFEYVSAASRVAQASGRQVLMWPNPVDDLDALRLVASQRLVDGFILMEVRSSDPRVAVLQEYRLPFVLIGRTASEHGMSWVDADFSKWGPMAIDALVSHGHSDVVFLTQPESLFQAGYGPLVRTERDLVRYAASQGVNLHVIRAEATIRAGRDAFARMLAERPNVTAILGFNEIAMIGVLEGISASGRSVPANYSVLQFGIGPAAAEYTSPPQDTIGVDGAILGAQAAEFLLRHLDGLVEEPQQYLADPVRVDRGSVADAPKRTGSPKR
ncbi:MAG TPA: LacI family DNA-binding transcriptional regulator [Microbacteriaceae bacterium]|nr:LacI family DNA-binding transcriptional regulator [Microbacteriaceae bacterium]